MYLGTKVDRLPVRPVSIVLVVAATAVMVAAHAS